MLKKEFLSLLKYVEKLYYSLNIKMLVFAVPKSKQKKLFWKPDHHLTSGRKNNYCLKGFCQSSKYLIVLAELIVSRVDELEGLGQQYVHREGGVVLKYLHCGQLVRTRLLQLPATGAVHSLV